MSLQQLLEKAAPVKKIGLSEERVTAQIPNFTNWVSFWREYPDKLVDMMTPPDSSFKLFFYQRIFLRAAIRHKYCYATFTRAFSKSFLSVLVLILRCILYPGAKLFIASGGKEQAANIAKEKVEELIELLPFLHKEIDWRPGKTQFAKDYVRVQFRNGSRLDIVAVRESTRGGRRHGGLIEEVILVDGEKLNTVILPLMNVSRRAQNGEVDPRETLNKSQIYVTTAGFRDSFAYQKQLQLLLWQIVRPGEAFVFGGTWRIPVKHKLLDRGFVQDMRQDGTFNEASFGREYESNWSGTMDDAFFNADTFDKHRVLNQPEEGWSGRGNADHYYIFGVDVGRQGAQTAIMVFKVNPQPKSIGIKSLVNIYTVESEHFEQQSLFIKRLYYKYQPKAIAVDANGLGAGLVDYLITITRDERTGEEFPPFGVINDDRGDYRKYYSDKANTEQNTLFLVKANADINNEAHVNVSTQFGSGKLRLLIDERTAKAKLLATKVGADMTPEARSDYLRPFVMTSILKEEMMNLREKREGKNVVLDRANNKIQKDKFSAFEYGLYYIKILEDNDKKKRGKYRASDFMFFS
jgi:hypothetical protein